MFWVFDMAKEVANIVCVGRAGNYIYVPHAKSLARWELPTGENSLALHRGRCVEDGRVVPTKRAWRQADTLVNCFSV